MLFRLINICKRSSSKYTRSKVRKALPKEFSYIIEELLHEDAERIHKHEYYNVIIDTIIELDCAANFIIAICELIQRLAIDHLHVIGDIYDRGPYPDKVLDMLKSYHSVDIQWGNHDICWMGAATGSEACICNCIRISAKYNHLHTIEESYGINLIPLATFAMEYYGDDECLEFIPEGNSSVNNKKELQLIAKMHKAICIMQLKYEYEVISRNAGFGMDDRNLLHKVDFEKKVLQLDGKEYPLKDSHFPTVDKKSPYRLTKEEIEVMEKITSSFLHSPKLQEHAKFLFNKGSMYSIYNGNLLFHGCIPTTEKGDIKHIHFEGKQLYGKVLLDEIDSLIRKGFFMTKDNSLKQKGRDIMWYLWCGPNSPLYGKDKMTTFERYFLSDKKLMVEKKDHYYTMRDNEELCNRILRNFGVDENTGKIVNGHVPVEVKRGESPIKANGKLLVIDGGFSKAYHKVTGIAGYTLIYNSKGLILTSHELFTSVKEIVDNNTDVVSNTSYIKYSENRIKVGNTDKGELIRNKINDLTKLVFAYNAGLIKEKNQ